MQRIARLSKIFDPSRVFTMPVHSAEEFEPDGPHVDDHGRAADRIGRELRRAADWKRVGGERRRGQRNAPLQKSRTCLKFARSPPRRKSEPSLSQRNHQERLVLPKDDLRDLTPSANRLS